MELTRRIDVSFHAHDSLVAPRIMEGGFREVLPAREWNDFDSLVGGGGVDKMLRKTSPARSHEIRLASGIWDLQERPSHAFEVIQAVRR